MGALANGRAGNMAGGCTGNMKALIVRARMLWPTNALVVL